MKTMCSCLLITPSAGGDRDWSLKFVPPDSARCPGPAVRLQNASHIAKHRKRLAAYRQINRRVAKHAHKRQYPNARS